MSKNPFASILGKTAAKTATRSLRSNAAGAGLAWAAEQAVHTAHLAAGKIDGAEYARRTARNTAGNAGGFGGSAAGAVIGSFLLPGVGTAVGGLIGGLLGDAAMRGLAGRIGR